MAQERFVTPEKQLLRLIEDQKVSAGDAQKHAAKHKGLSLLSLPAWMGRASFLKDNFSKIFTGGVHQLDVKLINRLLTFCIVMLTGYLITTSYISSMNLRRIPELELTMQEAQQGAAAAVENISVLKKALSSYLEEIRERDIFKMGPKPAPVKEAGAPAPKREAVPKIVEMTESLKLVGISWSKDPDAMIEDTKSLRTFFVKRGEMIGEVKVEAIFKDKVVLSYGGEEIEIK